VAAGLEGAQKKASSRESAKRVEAGGDYRRSAQPGIAARQSSAAAARAEPEEAPKPRPEKRRSQELDDYLDIPAFLRRQAD